MTSADVEGTEWDEAELFVSDGVGRRQRGVPRKHDYLDMQLNVASFEHASP